MNLYLIIFIRLNSKRLKNKGLLKIGNLSVLEIVLKRCLYIFPKKKIVIATSKNKIDDKILNIAKKNKIKVFRGSENNVRKRTIDCCLKFKIDAFIRMNSDRPFLNYVQLKNMINKFNTNKYDILTNCLSKNKIKGLSLEIIKFNVFRNIFKKIIKSDNEHIFNYFYRNKKYFKIYNVQQSEFKIKEGLSLDDNKDFERIKTIYERFNYNYLTKTSKILRYLKKK